MQHELNAIIPETHKITIKVPLRQVHIRDMHLFQSTWMLGLFRNESCNTHSKEAQRVTLSNNSI